MAALRLLSIACGQMRTDFTTSISALRASWAVTLARPFLGAVAAIPIAFFFQSGRIDLGENSAALLLALCFVGGFSERWFVDQIERIGGRSGG